MTGRIGSRRAAPPFGWTLEKSWHACLGGIAAVYVSYPSDLPISSSAEIISAFVDKASRHGVRRLVLLSGRGEAESQVWEGIVQDSGLDWTIVRASWFRQNFSEGAFVEMVRAGRIGLPADKAVEPFVDADDIADVAVAARTEPGHGGIHELTGPRLLSIAEVASEISQAVGRIIAYRPIPHEVFVADLAASGR
ncbi:MAG: NmrA family transcriptional regulator [Acidobacteriota bacterium]